MPEKNNRTSLEQGRAKFAYECAEKGIKIGKEYKSFDRKLPMLIKTNGLGAALAFAKNKDDASKKIYGHIYEWLKTDNKLGIFKKEEEEDLVAVVISQDSSNYRALTIETLAFLAWLKRFAEGLIADDK
jgi:CRISPR-associated protein Cmr5